jgi:hypothetical protein
MSSPPHPPSFNHPTSSSKHCSIMINCISSCMRYMLCFLVVRDENRRLLWNF